MAGAWCVGEGAERQGLRAVRRVDWHKVGSLPGALAFALSVKGSHGVLGAEGVQRSPLTSGRTIVKVGKAKGRLGLVGRLVLWAPQPQVLGLLSCRPHSASSLVLLPHHPVCPVSLSPSCGQTLCSLLP